ncbi:MAG: dockerin type I repeat-containing protein [Oscillospiraceae bacterium]|nr:dockerin type I repeat-containing protein [Oscillospiraceae bacterium]
MKRHLLPAAVLCGAMLLQSVPAAASYTGEDIAFVIRPEGDTTVSSDGCVHLSAAEAAAGTVLHFGIYIETDRAEVQVLGMKLRSDSENLTFVEESLETGASYPDEAVPQTYTLPDGTQFSTKFQPYCLGSINSKGSYSPNCSSFSQNCSDGRELTLYWLSGIEQATAFAGGQSDWFSFYTFDAALAPGTQPGSYRFEFQTAADAETAKAERLTYITSNDGTVMKTEYSSTIPQLRGIEIVVDAGETSSLLGDVNHDGKINAADATSVLIYAARMGTGGDGITEEEHQNMHAFGDVNKDGAVNAKDATGICRYAAAMGIGRELSWEEIFAS